jgi:hypothetical protein
MSAFLGRMPNFSVFQEQCLAPTFVRGEKYHVENVHHGHRNVFFDG